MVLPFSRTLLLSTSVAALYASGLTDYAVGSNEPEFVADFAGVLNSGTEYYRSGGSDTTFASVFTHSGLVLPATMTDSDGNLKWGAHNILKYSSDLGGADWVTDTGQTETSGQTDYEGGSTATLVERSDAGFLFYAQSLTISSSANYKFSLVAKKVSGTITHVLLRHVSFDTNSSLYFNLTTGASAGDYSSDAALTGSSVDLGDGFFRFTVDFSSVSDVSGTLQIWFTNGNSTALGTGGASSALVSHVHVYRSDLGGMVDNHDRGDSFVPTTTAARFLPRRNHYLYNGSTYDNAGILIEPAAATNIFHSSNDFTLATTNWAQAAGTITITGSYATGPDGVSGSASRLQGSGVAFMSDSTPVLSTVEPMVISVWVKSNGGGADTFRLAIDGTFVSSNFTATSEWQRFYFTTGTPPTIAGSNGILRDSSNNPMDLQIFGFQLEVGSVPTSYIPTSGTSVTRAAETLTVAGANLPANATGVSVQMQGRMSYADRGTEAQRTFWRWYNGASDFLLCDLDTDGADTGEVNANQSDTTGGAGTVAIDAYSPGINVAYNIASRHSNTDINLAVDGTAGTEDATPTALHDASSDTFQVAHNLQGTVGMLRVWGVGLSDTDLESAT